MSSPNTTSITSDITLHPYTGEHQMPTIISLIEKELSEPYIVYTYRYFVNQWPSLCFFAHHPSSPSSAIGVIVCKLDRHLKGRFRLMRGYIAMISVKSEFRGRGVAKRLVVKAVEEMVRMGAQEVVLETEADNEKALGLYEGLGFVREKRLHRFYLNGKDSFRLVLPIPRSAQREVARGMEGPPQTGLVQPPYAEVANERLDGQNESSANTQIDHSIL
ncbi:potential peptide N-acetyl transferase [Pseudozyma hubeiensis SY62]|uniref:Potential peptide N-acetyl transferase n=1 Tax=Pseudozyma hubeiensis (strain SY62) TaxID=1305764 RepID=R9P4Z6_PSEHS|nr:potential peptide N-acetyl transferase [Pseudozyma hubeiensis SY62]GAC96364.1 potential peptide N-acetyl transferase [Pseudozyma hubeiensis SY62]